MILALPLLWLGGVDTGVVFCRRADWETVGGYNEELLVSEDLQFLFDLKRLGRKRGQLFARPKGVKAITSTRKFDKHGDWRFLAKALTAPLLFLFSPNKFQRWARKYWYEDRDQ
jgi:hypothetical protein